MNNIRMFKNPFENFRKTIKESWDDSREREKRDCVCVEELLDIYELSFFLFSMKIFIAACGLKMSSCFSV